MLYREALFTPHSSLYRAITELLAIDVPSLPPRERDTEVSAPAARFAVDRRILALALAPEVGHHGSDDAVSTSAGR